MKLMKSGLVAAAMVALTGAARAALINRGAGLTCDTTRNIFEGLMAGLSRTSRYPSGTELTEGSRAVQQQWLCWSARHC